MQPRSVYIGGNYQLLPMFSNFFRKFLRKQERPPGRSYHTILCNFSQEGQRRNGVSQEVLCQAFFQESVVYFSFEKSRPVKSKGGVYSSLALVRS